MKFKSPVYSSASGSIAGITYSRAKGGIMYTRSRSMPTNPNTARQSLVRGVIAALSMRWSATLTSAQRDAWGSYATDTPVLGKQGDPLILSGQQMYLRCNTIGRQINDTTAGFAIPTTVDFIDDPPSTPGVGPAITSNSVFGLDPGSDTFTLTVGIESAPEAGLLIMQVGAPLSPGRSYFRGPYQLAAWSAFAQGAIEVDVNWLVTNAEVWVSQHVPSVGDRIPFRLRTLITAGVYKGKLGPETRRVGTVSDLTP